MKQTTLGVVISATCVSLAVMYAAASDHQEYVDKFCHIDFDVKEHGVFVYPNYGS